MIPRATKMARDGEGDRDAAGDIQTLPLFSAPTVMSAEHLPSPITLALGKVAAGISPNDPNFHFITASANASTTYGCTSTYINSLTFINFIYIYVF